VNYGGVPHPVRGDAKDSTIPLSMVATGVGLGKGA